MIERKKGRYNNNKNWLHISHIVNISRKHQEKERQTEMVANGNEFDAVDEFVMRRTDWPHLNVCRINSRRKKWHYSITHAHEKKNHHSVWTLRVRFRVMTAQVK